MIDADLCLVRQGSFFQGISRAIVFMLIVAAHHHVVALLSKAYGPLFVKRATFTEPTVGSPNQERRA